MSQGSMACIRYLLFAFNLVFVIFGGLLIYTGFSTFVSLNKYDLVVHNGPDGATIVLLIIGCAIFLTAFMGCCGAITSNSFMLRTFAFIITVLLIIELVSVSFVFAFKKTIHDEMLKGINEAIGKYNATDRDNAIVRVIDDIQQNFHCCGANGPSDWKNNTGYADGIKLPVTCCGKDMPNNTDTCSINTSFHFKEGCVNIITDELKSSVSFLGWVGVVVIGIQFIGIIFSCMLSNQRREYTYV